MLALCINTDGFIRYSSILEGNTADPKSLPDMVDRLIAENPADAPADQKVLVVTDAGISTKENLDLIREKGYRSTYGRLSKQELPLRHPQGSYGLQRERGRKDRHRL